jgi:hypothetical protein
MDGEMKKLGVAVLPEEAAGPLWAMVANLGCSFRRISNLERRGEYETG